MPFSRSSGGRDSAFAEPMKGCRGKRYAIDRIQAREKAILHFGGLRCNRSMNADINMEIVSIFSAKKGGSLISICMLFIQKNQEIPKLCGPLILLAGNRFLQFLLDNPPF